MNRQGDQAGVDPYRWAIGRCCNPDCKLDYGLEVHHITPIENDGRSNCLNYIVLCKQCHQQGTKHTEWYKWQETLYQWKFYNELITLGHTADDYTHDEYLALIRATGKARSIS